jgi:septal ring factor EnvC (AmiA/AmiB activator)
MMSSKHPCIAVADGAFVADFLHGKKSQVSTRSTLLFSSLLFTAVFLLFSQYVSSNSVLLGEISRLNQELDSFETLKKRLADDELELDWSHQQINQLESKLQRDNFLALDRSRQQINELESKVHKDNGTLEELNKTEQQLRDLHHELDLGLEKMLRGTKREALPAGTFSGLGHI